MFAIWQHGTEQQKQQWLPRMAAGESIGCFALTEPDHGSDSVALETYARRDGDAWILDGAKRWIGNGSIADVVVVWARSEEDGQVKGILVERDMPGFEAVTIGGKGASRAIWQAQITLDGVRWDTMVDKSVNETDVPHDYVELASPVRALRHLQPNPSRLRAKSCRSRSPKKLQPQSKTLRTFRIMLKSSPRKFRMPW
jgi:alkylation response protein AidB-like acyl-CoA dehydrogenase